MVNVILIGVLYLLWIISGVIVKDRSNRSATDGAEHIDFTGPGGSVQTSIRIDYDSITIKPTEMAPGYLSFFGFQEKK